MKTRSAPATWLRGPGFVVVLIALVQFALHLWTNAHDGIFRDEMYYVAAGQHLSPGYVEYPPLVAVVARLSQDLFGNSVFGLRLLPALAGATMVVLTGNMASMLGAGLLGQALAAVAVALDGNFMGGSGLLTMDPFDQLWWTLGAWVVIRLIKTDKPKLWLWFGAVIGMGLNTKLTISFFLIAVLAGLLLSQSRRWLFQRWLLFGGLIALVMAAPYIIWQIQHGLPVVEYTRIYSGGKTFQATPPEFLIQQILTHNPFSVFLWVAGLILLFFVPEGRPYRAFGWAYVFLFLFFMIQKTKFYWLAPAYPPLYAAGAYAFDLLARRRPRLAWLRPAYIGLLAISGLVFTPFAIPILSPDAFLALNAATGGAAAESSKQENLVSSELPQNYADRYGWQEMVAAIKEAYQSLTPEEQAKACVLTKNYGEAGAIDYFGPALGLPRAISGHNSYYMWGPQGCTGEVMISVGRPLRDLSDAFESVTPGPTWSCKYCMPYENGTWIYIARGLKAPMEDAWPTTKDWN